jgi:HAD superfamily hydrolase (TIGR01509 family)
MIDGVIFDMDGVLFDSERLYQSAWLRVGERISLPDLDRCVHACIGRNGRDILKYLTDKYGPGFPAENFINDIRSVFEEIVAADGLPLKPGVTEVLRWLQEANIPVGLATSSSFDSARRHLSGAGLIGYFREIITGNMVARGKPDPEIYTVACERLGIRPENSYAVEDSPNGIRSAHGAGLKVIMVPDLIRPTPEIEKLLYRIYPSLHEVKLHIEEHAAG